jgi:hypothetical protein
VLVLLKVGWLFNEYVNIGKYLALDDSMDELEVISKEVVMD